MKDYLEKPVLTKTISGIVHYALIRGTVSPPIFGSRDGTSFQIESNSPVKIVHFSYPLPVQPRDEVILARPLFTVYSSPHTGPGVYNISKDHEVPSEIRRVELLRLVRDGQVLGYWSDISKETLALPSDLIEQVEPACWIRNGTLRTDQITLDTIASEFPR